MYLTGKLGWIYGARILGELDTFEGIRLACSNKAKVCAAVEVTDAGIERLIDLQAELKGHENEIRRVRQELAIRIQTHRMREIISSHTCRRENAST